MIREISKEIFEKYKYEVEKYENEINNFYPNITISEEELSEYIELVNSKKKTDKHYAFLISLFVCKSFPENVKVKYTCSRIALDINYPIWVVSNLTKIRLEKNNESLGDIYFALAKAHRNLFQFDEALRYYKLAQNSYSFQKNVIDESWMIYSIGKMFLNYLQQPSRSIEYLLRAKNNFEKSDDTKKIKGISACLDEIGDVYRQSIKDYSRAIEIYNEAIIFNKKYKYYDGLSRNYSHIGICFEELGNLNQAEIYLNRGISLLRKHKGNEKGLGIRLTQLGNIQNQKKNKSKAIDTLIKGQEINKIFNNDEYIIKNNIYQGDYYYQKNNIDDAIFNYNQALYLSRKIEFHKLSSISYKKLCDCYFIRKLYEESKYSATESLRSNIAHWNNIKKGNPNSISILESQEIAEMYKSLFNKISDDYNESIDFIISNIEDVYVELNAEKDKQIKNVENVIRFANLISSVKHEIQNLHNNIIAVIDNIIIDNELNSEKISILSRLRIDIFKKSDLLSDSNFKEVFSNVDKPLLISDKIINKMINEIQADFRYRSLHIKHEVSDLSCLVSANINNIKSILFNIILNSSEAYSSISLKETHEVEIRTHIRNNFLYFEIQDFAGGVDEQIIDKIFETGFTTKSGGTGYGLSIVKSILKSLNGKIEVSNRKSGLMTTIKIPVI